MFLGKCLRNSLRLRQIRFASTNIENRYEVVIVGGGSGGLATAAILGNKLKTLLVEPSDEHYYQPYFTLVGAGLKQLEDCRMPLKEVRSF